MYDFIRRAYVIAQNKNRPTKIDSLLAEGVGFEPTDPLRSPVFKTGALGHYATLPYRI
jgi:hypothetical protein